MNDLENKIMKYCMKISLQERKELTPYIIEYHNYVRAGLQPQVALDYMKIKYIDKINLNEK